MTDSLETQEKPSIRVSLKYLASSESNANYVVKPNSQEGTEHHGEFSNFTVNIENARNHDGDFNLDKEGFCLVKQSSEVNNFYDDDELESIYNQEVVNLIQQNTGAKRVQIFDHTRRSSSGDIRSTRKVREPASIIHNDYSATSGLKRLQDFYNDQPEVFDQLVKKRFSIVNVWRSISGTVRQFPLGLCDAQSVDKCDLVDVNRQSKERQGQLQLPVYNQNHKWFYYPLMGIDEALLIKTFDTALDGRTRFTLHTAFEDPTADSEAPARESLETRCFVFYD